MIGRAALAIVVGSALHAGAQTAQPSPPARAHSSMTYDRSRGTIVLASGGTSRSTEPRFVTYDDLWTWDGRKWERLQTTGIKRTAHNLVYDPDRRVVMMVGGSASDGPGSAPVYGKGVLSLGATGWQAITTDSLPARDAPAADYDPVRHRLVVFGGAFQQTLLGDTYELDGTRWRAASSQGPAPRQGAVMAFHARTGKMILSGGSARGATPRELLEFSDTWTWDGSKWTLIDTVGTGKRVGAAVAADEARGEIVVFGGQSNGALDGTTWAWTGARWERRATSGPSPRVVSTMAYDPVRRVVVLFGGRTANGDLDDTWEWDGTRWREIIPPSTATSPRVPLVGAAFDEARGALVIVGGSAANTSMAQTWEWNRTAWKQRDGNGPSERDEPMLAYDRSRKRTVLYGGSLGRVTLGDTWEWDGSRWQRMATDGPSPRGAAGITYDSRRKRVVLFGGSGEAGKLYNDLWEWDGVRWNRIVPDGQAGNPPARALHAIAYDEARGRLVMAGGFVMENGGPRPLSDTWEWDGTAWQQINVSGPGARDHLAMAYAPDRRAVVMHGGGSPSTGLTGDTWLYDGQSWTKLLDDGPPRGRHRIAYDDREKAVLLYGGWGPKQLMNELWMLKDRAWTRVSP